MPVSDKIKKGTYSAQKPCKNHLLRVEGAGSRFLTGWECCNPHPPAPPVRADTEASRRESRFGDLLHCLWVPAALDAELCFHQELFLAAPLLARTDCYERHKECRRRPSCLQKATSCRIYFAALCREIKKPTPEQTVTSRKTCTQQSWGFDALGSISLILFLSCFCRQQQL